MTSPRRWLQRGMVTAEVAVVSAVLAGVTVLGIQLVGVAIVQVRCVDVAADVARHLSRGDTAAADKAADGVPRGGLVTSGRSGAQVSVTATCPATILGFANVTLRGNATTLLEPGVR